jgi:hypothetical protein
MHAEVDLDSLEHALDWVSSTPSMDAAAYISRTSGQIYLIGPDGPVGDDTPEDIEDGTAYVAVPHKNELDLGRRLVLQFVADAAPELSRDVAELFRRKGAYSRFKALMQRRSLLDAWHAYETEATRGALVQWAQEEGFVMVTKGVA